MIYDVPAHRTAPRYVYRIFDEDGVLLYVGQSINPEARLKDHRRKPWGHLIATWTLEGPYDGCIASEQRESEVIHDEKPLYALSRQQVGQIGALARAKTYGHESVRLRRPEIAQ